MDFPSIRSLQKLPFTPNQLRITDPKDWNLVIKLHAKINNDHAILATYTYMESLGIDPDKATLPLVLKACARLNAVERGRKIHRSIRDTGMVRDVRVGTALVDFYGKCGLVDDAREVFDKMRERDVVLWNAMIYGYVGCCCFEDAVSLFMRMQEVLKPNSRTIVGLLSACRELDELRVGQEIHGYCLRNGLFDLDPHVGTALIGFYLKFDARISRLVFDLMDVRNIVSWNAIISGYVDVGEHLEACNTFVHLLVDGVKLDSITVVAVVQACAELGFCKLGMQIHQVAIKCGYRNNLFVVNALLNMYSDCGRLDLACQLFEYVPNRDVALWNSMIYAYIEYDICDKALSLFTSMRTDGIGEDERTIAIMASSCPNLADGVKFGKSLHAHAIKKSMEMDNVSLGNALLGMYAELNCVNAAQKVFDNITDLDVISWNTLIMAFACNRLRDEAWKLFEAMQATKITPNSYTMISILATCDDETCLNIGRAIHNFVIKHDIAIDLPLNTALTDMYMNCGDEATARNLFERFPDRDVISWNALIASYVRNNQGEKAQMLFAHMISEVEPNSVTIISMLSSRAHLASLPQGQCLHAYVTRRQTSLANNLSLANAFVTMYARCGSMQNAEKVFKLLPKRNIISWNALMTGYSIHGRGNDAILAFFQMLGDGLQPNAATFLAILSACRHCGFIEKGLQFFQTMVYDFKIKPELVHYGCVVDLLCRGGWLNEAREFIESMPSEPDASLWRALLSACRVNSNTKLAATIFEKLVEIEPLNAGNYILLCNIYASAGLWLEVRKVRTWLQEKGLRKSPGLSWIVVRSQVHSFAAVDTSHPQSDIIYENLYSLMALIKESGYIPDIQGVLDEEED